MQRLSFSLITTPHDDLGVMEADILPASSITCGVFFVDEQTHRMGIFVAKQSSFSNILI